MRNVLILSTILLASCTSLTEKAVELLPSLQYCDRVFYQREFKDVAIAAQCKVP